MKLYGGDVGSSKVMDCAVIDEIQLLSDPHRGYAYTRALLGLRCWSCTCASRGRCVGEAGEVDGGFVGGESTSSCHRSRCRVRW